jgi:hypothetical protein
MTARPIVVPWKMTGNERSTVCNETFDGLLSVVWSVARMYSLPFVPPLPTTVTLEREVVPPKPFKPASEVETLKGMPEMGMSPMAVFAVTFAEPSSSKLTDAVSVTAAKNALNAASLTDCSVWFENEISRSTRLPVETPPMLFASGSVS